MAISEETKRDVAQRRVQLKAENETLLADIKAHEGSITLLQGRVQANQALIMKLKADIPEPTVTPPEA